MRPGLATAQGMRHAMSGPIALGPGS